MYEKFIQKYNPRLFSSLTKSHEIEYSFLPIFSQVINELTIRKWLCNIFFVCGCSVYSLKRGRLCLSGTTHFLRVICNKKKTAPLSNLNQIPHIEEVIAITAKTVGFQFFYVILTTMMFHFRHVIVFFR